ncbi:hypothetical protein O5707_07225 [Escherichia coli]|nr:hypothetical protein [Escherichia coli]
MLADGTWSLGIPAADVSNWPAGTVDITVKRHQQRRNNLYHYPSGYRRSGGGRHHH